MILYSTKLPIKLLNKLSIRLAIMPPTCVEARNYYVLPIHAPNNHLSISYQALYQGPYTLQARFKANSLSSLLSTLIYAFNQSSLLISPQAPSSLSSFECCLDCCHELKQEAKTHWIDRISLKTQISSVHNSLQLLSLYNNMILHTLLCIIKSIRAR